MGLTRFRIHSMGVATECPAPECPSDRVPRDRVPSDQVPMATECPGVPIFTQGSPLLKLYFVLILLRGGSYLGSYKFLSLPPIIMWGYRHKFLRSEIV